MKRTISILLAALLLLIALPTFAEGEAALQPGLYVSESGKDVLYLDELGCGVFNYDTGEQQLANGVLWTEASLEIERATIPYALWNNALIFTFDGAVRIMSYAGAGEDYALGDREGTAFAGTYLSEDGRKLVLATDGQGTFEGEAVLWGSLLPYWPDTGNVTENTCYILFDSYLSGMTFDIDSAVVNMEEEGDVTFVRQALTQPAGDGQLYYGYKMTTGGQTIDIIPFLTAMGMDPRSIYLELRADGTGTVQFMDEDDKTEFTWTEDTITVDGESAPYTREGDHIIISIEGDSIEFAPTAEVEALIGATGDDTEHKTTETGAASAEGLVGVWTLTKAKAMGIEIPASMMGTNMSLELKADGKAVLTSGDDPIDLDWALKEDGSIALSAVGSEIFTLTYDGTVLSLLTEGDSVELIFEKEN